MKRQISGTSVATAVLLVAAAILLCSRLQRLEAGGIALPVAAALLIEAAFYAGIVYLWCGRFRLRSEALGVAALYLIRIAVSAGAAAAAQLGGGPHAHLSWHGIMAPVWQSWMTAAGFTVVALALVRDLLLPKREAPAQRPVKDSARAQPQAAKVMFDGPPGPPVVGAGLTGDGNDQAPAVDPSLFQVLEPRRAAAGPQLTPIPEVEGWAAVPASVVAQQLPAGAEVSGEEILIPLALIMRELRTGEVRLPAAELDGVYLPPGCDPQETQVELPLSLIVPQLPDEALELGEPRPPSWLTVETPLEDIFFARV